MVKGMEGAGKAPQTRGQDILAAAPWRNKEFVRETEDQGRALLAQGPAWAKVWGLNHQNLCEALLEGSA